jgi:hypothetical protein
VWRELAEDDLFWATVATASTTLLIAVAVEGRTARERLDQLALEASRKRQEALAARETEWKKWSAAVDLHQIGGPDPGDLPPPPAPIPDEDSKLLEGVKSQGNRVAALLLALWTLGLSLLGSLVIVSPASYPGGTIANVGIVVTLACIFFGTCGLLWATTVRIQQG